MSDLLIPDLTFPKISYGSHGTPIDLRVLLYRGGAGSHANTVQSSIDAGQLGQPLSCRLPLVVKLHEGLAADVAKGTSQATILGTIVVIRLFYSWADSRGRSVELESAQADFKDWTEALLHRVRIEKSLGERTAYQAASRVGRSVGTALGIVKKSALLRSSRLRQTPSRKRFLSTKTDKQNLEDTFAFGHALVDICECLSANAIRGPLPVVINLQSGKKLTVRCRIREDENLATLHESQPDWRRARTLQRRSTLVTDASLDKRHPLLNLRIEAELLLFIAQTAMNSTQAARLRRSQYRFQTSGDEIVAYVYKARRRGEAVFRAFRSYKAHFLRYLTWLDAFFPSDEDDRLFPFIYPTRIPSTNHQPRFSAVLAHFRSAGIKVFLPRALRKTRVNWLLRRSRDPDLTAEMAQHTKEVLLRTYDEPHLQSAASEIMRFHRATDPAIAAPGPGLCVEDEHRQPSRVPNCPQEAPMPDCVSPDGCLFCVHHRDVMSQDYCWKLASHRHIKTLELARYTPPSKSAPAHPAHAVNDRINAKLLAIADSNDMRAMWVREGSDAVRAGRYHPEWDGFIQLLEATA